MELVQHKLDGVRVGCVVRHKRVVAGSDNVMHGSADGFLHPPGVIDHVNLFVVSCNHQRAWTLNGQQTNLVVPVETPGTERV